MSTIRSAPMRDAEVIDARAERRQSRRGRAVQWSVGLTLLAFGVPAWFVGGRYTVEGWVIWLNRLLGWFGVAEQLPVPRGWPLLALVIVAALIYSRVEVAHRPWRRVDGRWMLAAPLAWAAWVLIVGTDLGSTYQGIITPPAGSEQWVRDVAASDWASGFATFVLTFGPEWFILGGIRLLKG